MLSAMLLLSSAVAVAPEPQPKEPPAKLDLFGKEDWYQKQEGKEQEFVGTLDRLVRKGEVGVGRFNPYRLKMDKDTREVYVGGKLEVLLPYVGKRVKLTGKAVDMEVEGTKHREIWPARLEVLPEEKKGPQEEVRYRGEAQDQRREEEERRRREEEKRRLEEQQRIQEQLRRDEEEQARRIAEQRRREEEVKAAARELKVIGRAPWPAPARPGTPGQQVVIRSLDELRKATSTPPESLAKSFKVDALDFDKQMIVVATAGAQPTGGFKFDITSVAVKGDTLTVKWKLTPPTGVVTNAFTHPGEAVLVEKADFKNAVFDPPAPKGRGADREEAQPDRSRQEDELQRLEEELRRLQEERRRNEKKDR
jgi:hypothetical protein